MTDDYDRIARELIEDPNTRDDDWAFRQSIAAALRKAADAARRDAFIDALALATNRRDNFTLMGAKPAAVAGADEVCVFLAAELQRVRDGEHIPGRPGSKSHVTDCAATPPAPPEPVTQPDPDEFAPCAMLLTCSVCGKQVYSLVQVNPNVCSDCRDVQPSPVDQLAQEGRRMFPEQYDDAPLTLPVVGKAIVTTLPIDPEANKSPAGPGLTEAQIEEMVADANSFGARVGTLEKYVRIFAAEVRRLRTCVEETLAEHDDDLVSLHAARADIEQLRAANEGIPAMRDKIEAQRAKIKEACRERDQLRATVDQLTRERDEAREEAERQKFIADRVLQARREDIGMEITDNCLCGGSAKEAQQCPVHR